MEPIPIKVHAFVSAENFAQFNRNYWESYPEQVKKSLEGFQNQYKTYAAACCNKQTWLKLLISAYLEFLNKNATNKELSGIIKDITKCDKIMFFNDSKLILEI